MTETRTRFKAEELYPQLAAWMEIEAQLKAEGKTEREIEDIAIALRALDFDVVNAQFREAGLSNEQVAEFWDAMVPHDDPESVDE
jgi:hypothetical protein